MAILLIVAPQPGGAEGLEPKDIIAKIVSAADMPASIKPAPIAPAPPTTGIWAGTWSCPTRGEMILNQNKNNITGSVSGTGGEHFGPQHRNGGKLNGEIVGSKMRLKWQFGDGTSTSSSSTLSQDGTSIEFNWSWYGSDGRLQNNGIMECTRVSNAPNAPSGTIVRLQSFNYPGLFIRHRNYLGEITQIVTDLDRKDATFRIVPGLADGNYISFESINFPGYYLRHQGFRVKLAPGSNDDLFRKDATFKVAPGLANNSLASFESYNYPGFYIRHRNFQLYLERGNTDLFRKDTTFRFSAFGR